MFSFAVKLFLTLLLCVCKTSRWLPTRSITGNTVAFQHTRQMDRRQTSQTALLTFCKSHSTPMEPGIQMYCLSLRSPQTFFLRFLRWASTEGPRYIKTCVTCNTNAHSSLGEVGCPHILLLDSYLVHNMELFFFFLFLSPSLPPPPSHPPQPSVKYISVTL